MILPIGDQPNPRGIPLVTYLLIALNVAVYLLVTVPLGAQPADPADPAYQEYARVVTETLRGRAPAGELLRHVTAYDLFVFTHGFRPAEPSVLNLFASLFLHAGLLHLFGNMLFLWIYGDNVEHHLGAVRYLLAYIGTGVAASLTHALVYPSSELPAIGASGAISGVLGLYFVWFPRNHVRLLAMMPPFFMNVFLVPARLVLGLYLIADNLLPFLVSREPTGVAHSAHIGGFVAGLLAAWLLNRRQVTATPPDFARDTARHDPDAVRTAIAEGRLPDAAADYFALPASATRGLLSEPEALVLADWLRGEGHPEAALVVLRRHLRDHRRGAGAAEANVRAGTILLDDLRRPVEAYQHLRAGLDLDPPREVAAVARHGLGEIAALQKRQIGHPYRRAS